MPTLFEKIIDREIPAKVFYETDAVIVIEDISKKTPVHLLIIPKKVTKNFYDTPLELLEMCNRTVKKIADMLEIQDHFRVVVNNGYGQEIDHLHYHFHSDRGADKLTFEETGK